MSDSLLDTIDEVFDEEENEDDEKPDASDVTSAMSGDKKYWKSRNQARKIQDVADDEDEES